MDDEAHARTRELPIIGGAERPVERSGAPGVAGPFRQPDWLVEALDAHGRPLADADLHQARGGTAFQEITVRIPLSGEQPVIRREIVVASELVVRKARRVTRRIVRDVLRKQRVIVERDGETGARPAGHEHAVPPLDDGTPRAQ